MPDGDADFDDVEARLAAEALIVDVDGFEGPLDLLLMLSRTQKVDLRKISVLALAEQYLGVGSCRQVYIDPAAKADQASALSPVKRSWQRLALRS